MYCSSPTFANSFGATSEQKLWSHVTQTILFSRDLIERDAWIRCHYVDYVCEKGHEFVESLTLPCETSRAIHVNIDLLGHAKKEEIHRQAEDLQQSLRDYMNAMQSLPPPKAAGTLASAPIGIIYYAPLLHSPNAPRIQRR